MSTDNIRGHSGYHSNLAELVGKTLRDTVNNADIGIIEQAQRVGRDAQSGLTDRDVVVRSESGVAYSYTLGRRYQVVD